MTQVCGAFCVLRIISCTFEQVRVETLSLNPFSSHVTGKVSLPEYVRTEKSYILTEVAQAGDDCVKITGVPVGTHVLTIKTDPAHPNHVTTVSHVIVF